MSNGERVDPLLAFRFYIEIDGLIEAGFSECSGLQVETEVEDVREGGVNEYVYKLPKGNKHVNLTLKHGITSSDVLWKWHKQVISNGGKLERKTVNVILLDPSGEETWRWSFQSAYPVKWVGPDLKADGNAIAIESLEIAHHGFDKVARE